MKWGLVCNFHSKKACLLAEDLQNFLKKDHEVFLEKHISKKGYTLDEIDKKADIVITIGGDGTILRALAKIEKPIFAINSGGMGFLTESEPADAKSALKKIIDDEYNIEERPKLKVIVDKKRLLDAANEATVQTGRIAKMLYLEIFIENELMETFGCDGVIVATPTGSTSYALSAGGPILDPSVDAMVIAPLAPFKLSARPWVVPLEKKIGIRILDKSKDSKIVIDGESAQSVTPDSEIVITGSEKKARFIRFGETFCQMVRSKLVR